MKMKRKISIRKILQVFLTIVVSIGCVIAIVSASKIENNKTLTSVAVHFKNDKKYHFIEEKEIMDLAINNRNIDIMHTPISQLDIHSMQQIIMQDPWVAHAQVFIDNNRVLQMYVTQRIPVARIFQKDSKSYYLDGTLSIMPLSNNYIYYTTVVTNVPEMINDSVGWSLRQQIVNVVKTIQADSFWNAQISEVIVDSVGAFELVPVLGDQKILLGDASAMKDKLNNLFSFYKNVLNRIGWDKYETLDLRFKDQVVAAPALPYNGPVDKAVDKMNWINSIVETEAKNDEKDSVHVTDTKKPQQAQKVPLKQSAKPVAKGKPVGKTTVSAPNKNTKNAPVKKGLTKKALQQKPKSKTNNNDKNNKKATPKYVYPENKSK